MEAIDRRCVDCSGFHGYENCPYYDQQWKSRPDSCWEGEEDFNPWNPPYHQYYGEHEHQPLEQEEPQQGLRSGKKSLEELLEGFMARTESNYKTQEAIIKNQGAAIRNLEAQLQKLSRQIMEEYQSSPLSEEFISLEEQGEEFHIEENEACDLIEESLCKNKIWFCTYISMF